MVTLEQVKLLESKVGKALSYVESLSAENATLREKLDGYRRRIDELETIVLAFKEDQGRIEAGIVSALERLNQFEDAVERGINEVRKTAQPAAEPLASIQEPETPTLEAVETEAVENSEETEDVAAVEELPEEAEPAAEDDTSAPVVEKNGELDIF